MANLAAIPSGTGIRDAGAVPGGGGGGGMATVVPVFWTSGGEGLTPRRFRFVAIPALAIGGSADIVAAPAPPNDEVGGEEGGPDSDCGPCPLGKGA